MHRLSAHRLSPAMQGSAGACTRLRVLQMRRSVSARAATLSSRHDLPSPLPVFPVQPIGVFLPGMTKTLHLYEEHLIAMLEDALASGRDGQNFLATAVLEPYMGDEKIDSTPGCFVGGHNFLLSCGCLCKILQAKPYHGGTYLVRIRGEARLGLSALDQVEPYMRASIFPIADAPVKQSDMAQLRTKLDTLEDIMRDVQNLSSKFRCDETASIQQAVRWVNQPAMFPTVTSLDTFTFGSQQSEAEAAEHSTQQQAGEEDAATSGQEDTPSDQELVEHAARLSLAALQWLPQSKSEERVAVIRGRLLAAGSFDVLQRLDIAIEVMSEQRNSLAAKCALMGAQ